ncbi:ABC-type transport system, permease protein [Pseudomonas amygdali pv. mori]|uniref:ABC-type transport system, permease protein n=1 Tax=Pseudomonas amygdali pv. mori TaxID=34065 RepID=A0A0P9W772_PSEA0|nr:ABC-type transport system, permease protein [Pseudomonas amygdali pv. mori]
MRLPQYFVLMTPYAVTLLVMVWVASGKRQSSSQPGALGEPYIREERR